MWIGLLAIVIVIKTMLWLTSHAYYHLHQLLCPKQVWTKMLSHTCAIVFVICIDSRCCRSLAVIFSGRYYCWFCTYCHQYKTPGSNYLYGLSILSLSSVHTISKYDNYNTTIELVATSFENQPGLDTVITIGIINTASNV